jgi:hypothetical protein
LPAPETPLLPSQTIVAESIIFSSTAGSSPSIIFIAKHPGLPTIAASFISFACFSGSPYTDDANFSVA